MFILALTKRRLSLPNAEVTETLPFKIPYYSSSEPFSPPEYPPRR
jgi:hypothetical protein